MTAKIHSTSVPRGLLIHVAEDVTVVLKGTTKYTDRGGTRAPAVVDVILENGDEGSFSIGHRKRDTVISYRPNNSFWPPPTDQLRFVAAGAGKRILRHAEVPGAPTLVVNVHPTLRVAFADTMLR